VNYTILQITIIGTVRVTEGIKVTIIGVKI
jgi:hypothetical protein